MKKISFDQLGIELTRKCNMFCDHCLRGDAQDIDNDFKNINKVLRRTEHINNVVFTGGEPTLNLPLMKKIFERIKKYKISLGSFYVVTNGKKYSEELLLLCLEMFEYSEDKEFCGISLSIDQFHDEIDEKSLRYKSLSFYESMKEQNFTDDMLISEGRSYENGMGRNPDHPKSDDFLINVIPENNIVIVEDMFYISSNGNICNYCDYSYENIDDHSPINLNNLGKKDLVKEIIKFSEISKYSESNEFSEKAGWQDF